MKGGASFRKGGQLGLRGGEIEAVLYGDREQSPNPKDTFKSGKEEPDS